MTGGGRSDCIITPAQGWCSVLAGPAPQRLASPPFASVAGLAHRAAAGLFSAASSVAESATAPNIPPCI